jgi:hypothetical protein
MLLARDATLYHSTFTTDLDRWPASSTAPAAAITSVGGRQRRLYQLIFPANAVPSHLRRESRFAPLIELAERLLRRDPAQRPPPNRVLDVLEASEPLLTSLHRRGLLGWQVTAWHLSPSDDVREACAGRTTPWWLRWGVRSQLYWAHVFFNTEAAWRREARIARSVALAWGVGAYVFIILHLEAYTARQLCITLFLALGTPGYFLWLYLVLPYLGRESSGVVTLGLWLFQVLSFLPVALPTRQGAARLPLVCAALGMALCPLWQALVTWLPAECRLFAVLGPIRASADTATSAAQLTDSRGAWSWGRFARARSKLDYPTEAALRSELAALQELARIGGAPPACTLTARDACEGDGPARTFRLALAIDVEPLAALVTRPGAYTSWEAWQWLHQAAGALAYLNDRGMHHGNLNLESVLITCASRGCGACGGRQVRLCRFSQPRDVSTAFASPEKADFVAAGQMGAPYDEAAADVWSLGVLVVTLLSRQPPPPPDGLRRLGRGGATKDEVVADRFGGVTKLCGLQWEDEYYSSPGWAVRSRFLPFIKLAEWALRLLPSQRPLPADAERYLSASSPFVWRTHGAGVFRLPGLRRRWRDDLVDLLSPSVTGLMLRQAVKVQVFWTLTLSAQPQHAHLRRAFDRVICWTVVYEAAAVLPLLLGFHWVALALLLAVPDVDHTWVCASPRLARAALWASRTGNEFARFELKYALVFPMIPSLTDSPLPAWFWPALGAIAVGRVLVVVGCALLWVHSAGYMGRPQQNNVRAVEEGHPAEVELEAGRLSLLEHAV